MRRTLSTLSVLFFYVTIPPLTFSIPLPERVYVQNATSLSQNTTTIADIVQHQTDTIKRIVSDHRHDYPIITRHPPVEEKIKKDNNFHLDDLKIKCQHLSRLIQTTTAPRNRTQIGFYITTEEPPPSTPKPTVSPAPVKYIKLEPIILQKTVMGDGRTIYYWHKQIPGQIAPIPAAPPSTTMTTTTTTTTTTPAYGFRNFFPSFYAEPTASTTTEKATTAEEVRLYQQQLKFVVPVPYVPPEEYGLRNPWEFDQYAFYPKLSQPENVNVQVPYVPTFHVIKAIAVPNQYEGGTLENT